MLITLRHWSYTILTVHPQLKTNKNSMLIVTKTNILNSQQYIEQNETKLWKSGRLYILKNLFLYLSIRQNLKCKLTEFEVLPTGSNWKFGNI